MPGGISPWDRSFAKIDQQLSDLIRLTEFFPPDGGIVGTVEHLRQFLLDLAQAVGAQLERGLIDRIVPTFFRESGIQVAQIGNFLAKAGEMFRNIWHLLDHTPNLVNVGGIRRTLLVLVSSAGASGPRDGRMRPSLREHREPTNFRFRPSNFALCLPGFSQVVDFMAVQYLVE